MMVFSLVTSPAWAGKRYGALITIDPPLICVGCTAEVTINGPTGDTWCGAVYTPASICFANGAGCGTATCKTAESCPVVEQCRGLPGQQPAVQTCTGCSACDASCQPVGGDGPSTFTIIGFGGGVIGGYGYRYVYGPPNEGLTLPSSEYCAAEGGYDWWEDACEVIVPQVSLIPEPCNSPSISPFICLNAEPQYEKAKWKVLISPDIGLTATLNASNASVNPGTAVNGTIVEVTGASKGQYTVTATLDEAQDCPAVGQSVAFELEFAKEMTDLVSSSTTGGGTAIESSNKAIGVQVPNIRCTTDGAQVARILDLRLIADPQGYSGSAKGRAQVTFNPSAHLIKVRSWPCIGDFVSIEASYGIVNATVPGTGSCSNAVGGVASSVSIDGNGSMPAQESVSAPGGCVNFFEGCIEEDSGPGPGVTLNDYERTYVIGAAIPLEAKVAAASHLSDTFPERADIMNCHISFGSDDVVVSPVPNSPFKIGN